MTVDTDLRESTEGHFGRPGPLIQDKRGLRPGFLQWGEEGALRFGHSRGKRGVAGFCRNALSREWPPLFLSLAFVLK